MGTDLIGTIEVQRGDKGEWVTAVTTEGIPQSRPHSDVEFLRPSRGLPDSDLPPSIAYPWADGLEGLSFVTLEEIEDEFEEMEYGPSGWILALITLMHAVRTCGGGKTRHVRLVYGLSV